MSFLRKDFHGGRAYASEPSDTSKPWFGSVGIGWIKLLLGKRTPVASPGLPHRNPHWKSEGYSRLGSSERHSRVRELDTKIFPMAHRRQDAAE